MEVLGAFLLAYLWVQMGQAQLPVQVFGSDQVIEYNFLWYKDLDNQGKVNLFNFTFFTIDYNNQAQNTYEIYQVVTYNFTKQWGLASGGRFTNKQFVPQLAVSYQLETKYLYLNIFPTLQLFPDRENVGYSLFGLLLYTPKITDQWTLLIQLTFEPLFGHKGYLYSYQQVRLGVGFKDLLQFDLGANLEQFGTNLQLRQNYGLFIRKELN